MRREIKSSRHSTMTSTVGTSSPGKRRVRANQAAPGVALGAPASRRRRRVASRRRGLQRLRVMFFQCSEAAQRYDMTFEQVVAHVWRARRAHDRLLLRSVNCMDDLIHAAACLNNNTLAWTDLPLRHERTLVRRCREGRDETETTVIVRRFVAELRRACLARRDQLLQRYAGTRPLRNWLADELNKTLLERQRSAFLIDAADAPCATFQFTPSGTGW